MKCPKCGYHRQSRDNAFVPATECPACGVVYAKHENKATASPARRTAPAPPSLKPSPVDVESLKKARDRVEKRLRKRQEPDENDERHARTLELARQITEEGLRKRQQEKALAQEDPSAEAAGSQAPEADAGLTAAADADAPSPADEATLTDPVDDARDAHAMDEIEQMEYSEDTDDMVEDDLEHATALDPPEDAQAMDAVEEMAYEEDTNAMMEDDPEHAAALDPPQMVSAATVPGDAPDTDVHMETIILTSAKAVTATLATGPQFEATPLDEDDTPLNEDPEPSTAAADAPEETTPDHYAEGLEDTQRQVPETAMAGKAPAPAETRPVGNRNLRMLSAVAWLILGAGIVGAVLSWTTISDVEAGMRIPVPDSVSSMSLGLLLGFAYLATGVLGFAFFWVSSNINRQLKDIRRLLMLNPGALTELSAEDPADDEDRDAAPNDA